MSIRKFRIFLHCSTAVLEFTIVPYLSRGSSKLWRSRSSIKKRDPFNVIWIPVLSNSSNQTHQNYERVENMVEIAHFKKFSWENQVKNFKISILKNLEFKVCFNRKKTPIIHGLKGSNFEDSLRISFTVSHCSDRLQMAPTNQNRAPIRQWDKFWINFI